MSSRLCALSFALSLCACASQDGSATTAAAPATTATPEAPPPEPRAEIKIAVASVQLLQDCPDPVATPTDAAAPADSTAPAAPPPAAPVAAQQQAPTAKRMAPGSNWQPPCTQSTVQLSLTNTGDREGKIRVNGIKLFDVATKRELGQITSRKPSLWNDTGVYQAWDERVAPGATVTVAYSVSDPDWEKIHKLVGETENLYSRPLLLEIDISVDDRSQTARSPEFTRQEVHLVVT